MLDFGFLCHKLLDLCCAGTRKFSILAPVVPANTRFAWCQCQNLQIAIYFLSVPKNWWTRPLLAPGNFWIWALAVQANTRSHIPSAGRGKLLNLAQAAPANTRSGWWLQKSSNCSFTSSQLSIFLLLENVMHSHGSSSLKVDINTFLNVHCGRFLWNARRSFSKQLWNSAQHCVASHSPPQGDVPSHFSLSHSLDIFLQLLL